MGSGSSKLSLMEYKHEMLSFKRLSIGKKFYGKPRSCSITHLNSLRNLYTLQAEADVEIEDATIELPSINAGGEAIDADSTVALSDWAMGTLHQKMPEGPEAVKGIKDQVAPPATATEAPLLLLEGSTTAGESLKPETCYWIPEYP